MAFTEKIGTLTRTSSTQVQLSGTSIIKLGGQQRVLTSPTLLTSVSGIGGVDTGAIAASSFYYVYAVYNGSATGIVASLSASSPTGFTRYKKVGAFYTGSGSLIIRAYEFGEVNTTVFSVKILTNNPTTALVDISTPSWVSCVRSGVGTTYCTFNPALGLTQSMNCSATVWGTAANTNYAGSLSSQSNIGFNLTTGVSGTVSDSIGVEIVGQKSGVDAIQPDWT